MLKQLANSILTLFFVISMYGFTWQGTLNPDEIVNWPKKSETITPMTFGTPVGVIIIPFIRTIHRNPNNESDIKTLKAFYLDYYLMAYSYYENGKPHSFVFDRDKDEFVELDLTPERRKKCVGCHNSSKDKNEKPSPKDREQEMFDRNEGEITNTEYQLGASKWRG